MTIDSAGGAATNSGIDFQQRVAAYVMAHMLTGVQNYRLFQLNDPDVLELRFETDNSIDDLILITTDGRVLIQAKRTLSLSESIESEFSAVIGQFVEQFVEDGLPNDTYVIATTSRSSGRITRVLRKLTEAARLNETSSRDNPLTREEEGVLNKTYALIRSHYIDKTGREIADHELDSVFRRIRVALLDLEEGAALEAAVLVLLAGKSAISPVLLWGCLISLCLSLAKDRQSLDKNGLLQRMGKYLRKASDGEIEKANADLLRVHFQGTLCAGREVLLVTNSPPGPDYFIFELYRFNNDGSKRLHFVDDRWQLPNGEEFNVIHRTATLTGMQRYLENNSDRFAAARVVVVPINSEDNIENTPHARAHAGYCANLIASNANPLRCLHCEDPVSEDKAPLVEIDQEHHEHCVGLVHLACLRPADRVLGLIDSELFRENRLIRNFDYNAWFLAAERGQGMFRGYSHVSKQVFRVAWTPDYNRVSKGLWCIKINLEDGSARYESERGKVVRYSRAKAKETAEWFSQGFESARLAGDPNCYTSKTGVYGSYSTVLNMLTEGEECLLCVSAEAVGYSSSVGNAYSQNDHYYAPLAVLIGEETGLPIVVEGTLFLISNPLRLERSVENWRRAGLGMPDFLLHTIDSDDEFDKFVLQLKEDGIAVVVDPVFDMKRHLSSGFVFENYYDVVGGTEAQD